MPYPPAITLRPCTVGGSTALESGTQLVLSAEITASRSLKWGATGWQFPSLTRTITGTEGAELSFSLPVTDLAGWRLNDDSGSIIDVSTPGSYTHTYTVKLKTHSGVRQIDERIIGPFILPTEDGSPIDLDLMLPAPTVAGGVVSVPGSWDARVAAAEAAVTGVVAEIEHRRIAPTIFPMTERSDYRRIAAMQSGAEIYALHTATAGAIPSLHKTADGGFTWTDRGALPAITQNVRKLASGTLLAIEPSSHAVPGGSNPRVWRSTDDGASWALVTTGLVMGPLTSQGICEGTDGSVMIAEYTSATTAPNGSVRRSADDGVTWTAVLTATNRHIHSVTYDPVAGKHVVFADDTTGGVPPQIWTSANNGATWQLLGEVTDVDHPNFVAPMYFPDYIAWGSDNQINGRISRILRSDFYAGHFDRCEQVAILNRRAIYASFPIRPDVWAISFNGEHINSALQPDTPGNTSCDIWLVSDNGALVSGGLTSYYALVQPGALSGVRPSFPGYMEGVDNDGFTMVNMPVGQPVGYTSVPITQGWEPHSARLDHTAAAMLPPGVSFRIRRGSSPADGEINFIQPSTGYVAVRNDAAAVGVRAELQYKDGGDLEFRSGGTALGWLRYVSTAGRWIFNKALYLAQNNLGIFADSTATPEGAVTADPGSMFHSWTSGGVWYKFNGVGNTGWRPIPQAIDTAANFALASATVNTSGKFEGRAGYDTTNDRAMWASGAAATAPWKYADGTTAITPA